MFIDETGAADGELKVTVEDEVYHAEANYDLDHDGVDDSAVVETDDGGHLAFSDTDGDGDADLMTTFDKSGEIVGQARFDASSGEWVAVHPSDDHSEQTNSNAGRSIVVDTERGQQNVGAATDDTDGDGRADTAVVKDEDGDTWLFTDVDGDGHADLATEVTRDGEVTTSKHTADDQWTEVEHGRIDEHGKYVPDGRHGALGPDADELWSADGPDGAANGGADHGSDTTVGDQSGKVTVSGVVRIDSVTGQWISPN
ncbi:hypothetical protein [Actinosynnema sp. NPDC020468]|uniref:hypothetical protein n=1 Tax=Actinosynnema sp. NPDC020468 TaxID=3154488 RepID=UPI0033C4B68D